MGVLKNDVGRPSNKVKNTRFIIKLIGLLIFIIGISVVLILLQNKLKEENVSLVDSEGNISLEKIDAKQFMYDFFGKNYLFIAMNVKNKANIIESYEINYNNDEVKTMAAINSSKKLENVDACKYLKCEEVPGDKDSYKINGHYVSKTIDVYSEKDVEKEFNKKFTSGKISKKDLKVQVFDCEQYFYKDNKYFAVSEAGCGLVDGYERPLNYIYKVEKQENKVFIHMVTSEIVEDESLNYYVVSKDGEKIKYSITQDDDSFVQQYGSKLNSYSLEFEYKKNTLIFNKQIEKVNRIVKEEKKALPECKVEKKNYNGLSKAEMLHKRLTMGWWNYLDNGDISSKELDSHTKIISVMHDLGYINFDKDDYITSECKISIDEIDKTITKIFEDNRYDPNAFTGSSCIPLYFEYDSSKKIYKVKKANDYGCGSSGGYVEKIYDSKESDGIYTFKTKVLMISVDGIMNISENNEFNKITEGIPEGVTEDNVFDKYSNQASIYEWTFIKKNNDYAFRNIKKIK